MNMKDNIVRFPGTGTDQDHNDDASAQESPDPQELQRAFGQLVDALNSRPMARPEREIRIRNFRSARLELTQDLNIVLEENEDHCIANSYDTGQCGYGFSPEDAISHLCSVLEDYYDLLVEDEGRLSPRLESHLRYFRAVLRERAQ